MILTGSMRTTAAAGTALLAGGLLVSVKGVVHDSVTYSLGGTSLVVTALTLIALVVIRTWIGDAREERRELAEARRQADAEQRRYFALQAALEGEMARLTQDVAADRARNAAILLAERQAMQSEFEEKRLQYATEAFRTGVEMERAGMLKPDASVPANLIQFPKQGQPSQSEQHARSREHGVVGP